MIKSATLLAALITLAASQPAHAEPLPSAAEVDAQVDTSYPGLFALYKDLHQHPELAFQETWTASRLAGEMRRLGFKVTEGVGRTGLVALFENGPGATVMVRTELDALPLEEKTGLPYASRVARTWEGGTSPVMHACGHDVHMTSWLGAAKVLVALKDQWRGRLMFIAQPAEEGLRGAKAMLADGLLTRFPRPDFGFALHVNPSAAGSITIKPGTNSSASDSLEILFKGRGGHGSMPSAAIDPIVIAARFVTDVQSIISREKDAGQFGVITVGAFQAGTVANIIPDTALLKLTLRSFSPQVRKQLLDGVQRAATASALLANAPAPEVRIVSGTGAVVSDEALANRTAEVFKRVFGEAFTLLPSHAEPASASEDFSEYIAAGIPSVFFGVGVSDPAAIAAAQAGGPPVPVNHSPYFTPVPEPSIKTAVRAMTLAVLEALRQ
jgi:hippurate hydrolase